MILEIEKNNKDGSYKKHRIIKSNELDNKYPYSHDFISWVKGGRIGSRFEIANKNNSFVFFKINNDNKLIIKKIIENYF